MVSPCGSSDHYDMWGYYPSEIDSRLIATCPYCLLEYRSNTNANEFVCRACRLCLNAPHKLYVSCEICRDKLKKNLTTKEA